jgi:hypothetical protein
MMTVSKQEVFDICVGEWDEFFENVVSNTSNGWDDDNHEIIYELMWEWLHTHVRVFNDSTIDVTVKHCKDWINLECNQSEVGRSEKNTIKKNGECYLS